jgi:hypothetical protein
MPTIVTTYLKGRKQADLLPILQALKVDTLIDVRYWASMPWEYSPHVEELRDPLITFEKFLTNNIIDYHYERQLGFPSKDRKRLMDKPEAAKEFYQNRILTDIKANKVFKYYVELMQTLWQHRVICLVCSCDTDDITQCHRFWLADLFRDALESS